MTLPSVSVITTADDDRLVTQGRAATVGKSSVSIQDTPFSVDVIDVEQARETGAKNVQDVLLYSAGVYAGQYGFDTRGDWASIRGLSPSTYIDGLRSIYGYYNNVRPEIYTLDRVEVLKGPSSVLYGQAELGGIVNVVSKRPQKTAAREIEVQLGSHDRKQIATDLTGPLNESGDLLYRIVALKRNSDTQVDHVNDDALVFMPSLTWKPTRDTSLTLQYLHQQNDSKVSSQFLPSKGTIDSAPLGRIPTSRFAGEPDWDRYDTKKNELSLFWDQKLSDAWKLAASIRQTNSSSVTKEIYTRVGAVPDDAGNIARTAHAADRKTDVLASDVRLEGVVKLGPTRHTVAVGVDYQNAFWEEYNYASVTLPGTFNVYNPVYGLANPDALALADRPDNKIVQTGIYAMDHMEWGPWVVSGAVRHDRARNTLLNLTGADAVARNTETTGRLGLMYRFDNGISPYISKSTAFSPNLGNDGTSAASILKPTTGEQKEAGVKYLSASGNTSATFAWFDIEQKNRVSNGSTPGGVEQVGAKTDGWELGLRQRIGQLELLANYTSLDAINDVTKKRLSSVPEKTASAWAQYLFGSGWRAGVGGRYIGDVTGGNELPKVPSVKLYDAMVGYTTGPWDLVLSLQNLADKEYISWCRGAGQDCGYGERRNVLLTANYNF
ncbi:MAG: TonB-dependent siderophore receptor [Burkholderiaceae bacterium]